MTFHLPNVPFLPTPPRTAEAEERRMPVLRIVRINWPFPALELVRRDGTGWLLMRLPSARYRLHVQDSPRRGLYLADTPRPDCLDCLGLGGWSHAFADFEGGGGDSEWVPCICWDAQLAVRLLPLPRTPRARSRSDIAPY